MDAVTVEPLSAFGTFDILQVGVGGLIAVAVRRPRRRVGGQNLQFFVVVWPGVENGLIGQSKLAVLFDAEDCALVFDRFDVQIDPFFRGKDLSRGDVLTVLAEKIIG